MALLSTSSERTATLPDKRVHNVYDDIIHCEVPPPNLKTANISGYLISICGSLCVKILTLLCHMYLYRGHIKGGAHVH